MNPPAAPLKIGQVHALLRQDYPNLELSKIRYYEEMGLVTPARSRKGYRLYGERDIACLREAIRMADEEFVPLRVIRVRLIDQGLLRDEPRPAAPAARQAARSAASHVVSMPVPASPPRALSVVATPDTSEEASSVGPAPTRLTLRQLLDVAGVEPAALNQVIGLGLVPGESRPGEALYDAGDVTLVRAAATLLRLGADPRQLGALRRVVERQMGIVDELADLSGARVSEAEVAVVRRDVAEQVEALRAALLERLSRDL